MRRGCKLLGRLTIGTLQVPVWSCPDTVMKDGETPLLGHMTTNNLVPRIDLLDQLKGDGLRVVFLHELLHLVADTVGVKLSEQSVEGLSQLLAQALSTLHGPATAELSFPRRRKPRG